MKLTKPPPRVRDSAQCAAPIGHLPPVLLQGGLSGGSPRLVGQDLEGASLVRSVKAIIARKLASREVTVTSREVTVKGAARRLAMSRRSLQRHLCARGLTFVALVQEVRQASAVELLRDPELSIGEIAERLGYAESGAFSRAFKRWTGLSPRHFRAHGSPQTGREPICLPMAGTG